MASTVAEHGEIKRQGTERQGTERQGTERQGTEGSPSTTAEDRERAFVLRYIQPGLAGLMDGSVSTLAPIFAVAFATHNARTTFLIGLAAHDLPDRVGRSGRRRHLDGLL